MSSTKFIIRESLNLPLLKRMDGEGSGRFYVDEDGNRYDSVTSILGRMIQKPWLKKWKERIGEEEASRISRVATNRGTKMHDLLEKFILNDEIPTREDHDFLTLQSFAMFREALESELNEVIGCEEKMFSRRYRIAGTCDLIAIWNGKTSIVDFKTSKKNKTISQIQDYFLQTAMYGLMYEEHTKEVPENLVILMNSDEWPKTKVFVEPYEKYLNMAIKIIEDYHAVERRKAEKS